MEMNEKKKNAEQTNIEHWINKGFGTNDIFAKIYLCECVRYFCCCQSKTNSSFLQLRIIFCFHR